MDKKDIDIPFGICLRTIDRNERETLTTRVVKVARRLGMKFLPFSSPTPRQQNVESVRSGSGAGAEIVARFLDQTARVTDQEFGSINVGPFPLWRIVGVLGLSSFAYDPFADVVIREEDLP